MSGRALHHALSVRHEQPRLPDGSGSAWRAPGRSAPTGRSSAYDVYAACIPASIPDSTRIGFFITEYAAASAGCHSAESPEKQV
jgi:hypothetical protein